MLSNNMLMTISLGNSYTLKLKLTQAENFEFVILKMIYTSEKSGKRRESL